MSPDPQIALDLHRLIRKALDQWQQRHDLRHDVSESDMVISAKSDFRARTRG